MSLPPASQLLNELAERTKRPTAATFQVTDRCNYDCVHCYQDHDAVDEMDTDEVFSVLEQLAEAGVLFLLLMGGEFFMRRDADAILERAHELGFQINLKSTGHHIHDRRADLIASLKPITVELSLYAASRHLHEGITTQAGSYERTVKAARRLVARGVRVIFNCPVTESTAGEVKALELLATEMGAEFSCDASITPKTNGDTSPAAMRMRWRTLMRFFSDHNTEVARELTQGFSRKRPQDRQRPLDGTPCRAGHHSVGITPKGKVWPCMSLPVECGDLRVESFDKIWSDSAELHSVRNLTWATLGECARCDLREHCSRCHATALTEHGEIRGPSLEACRQAVAVRDTLREQGLVPESDISLPPTWDRVDLDGMHHVSGRVTRSPQLRILP